MIRTLELHRVTPSHFVTGRRLGALLSSIYLSCGMGLTPFDPPGKRLDAYNVSISSLTQSHVTNSVQRYVEDQRKFLRQHGREGAALLEEWRKESEPVTSSGRQVSSNHRVEATRLAMIPSSPLLIPRVRLAGGSPSMVDPKIHLGMKEIERKAVTKDLRSRDSLPSSKEEVNALRASTKTKKSHKPRPQLKLDPPILDEYDASESSSYKIDAICWTNPDWFSKDWPNVVNVVALNVQS